MISSDAGIQNKLDNVNLDVQLLQDSHSDICKKLGINEKNTGDTAFQVALFHQEISKISHHLKTSKNPKKDKSALRGLHGKINARRTAMLYLRKHNPPRASMIAKLLGLKL